MGALVFAFLGTYAIHSTLLFGAAWLTARFLASPRAKELLWKGALVGSLLTSVASTSFGGGPLSLHMDNLEWPGSAATTARITSQGSTNIIGFQGEGPAPGLVPEVTLGATPPERGTAAAAGPKGSMNMAWYLLLGLWAVAVGTRLVRLGREHAQVRKLIRSSTVVRGGHLNGLLAELNPAPPNAVTISTSPVLTSPLAWGKSRIVIPAYLPDVLDDKSLAAMLAHEAEHLRRRDGAWLFLARFLRSLFAFQPMQTKAIQQLGQQAELLCDEAAMQSRGGGVALAKCLATVAERLTPSLTPNFVPAMASTNSQLMGRVERALSGTPSSLSRSRQALLVSLGAGALVALACTGPALVPGQVDTEDSGTSANAALPLLVGDLSLSIYSKDEARAGVRVNGLDLGSGDTNTEDLRAYLSELWKVDPSRAVVIEASQGTVYTDIAPVVEAVLGAGFTDLRFLGASSNHDGFAERFVTDPDSEFFVGSPGDGILSEAEIVNLEALGYTEVAAPVGVEARLEALGYAEVAGDTLEIPVLPEPSLVITVAEDGWIRIGGKPLLGPDDAMTKDSVEAFKSAIAGFEKVPLLSNIHMLGLQEVIRIKAPASAPIERVQRVLMLCSMLEIAAWNLQLDLGMQDGKQLLFACPLPFDVGVPIIMEEEEGEMESVFVGEPIIKDKEEGDVESVLLDDRIHLDFRNGKIRCEGLGMVYESSRAGIGEVEAKRLRKIAAAVSGKDFSLVVGAERSTDCGTVAMVLECFRAAGIDGKVVFQGVF